MQPVSVRWIAYPDEVSKNRVHNESGDIVFVICRFSQGECHYAEITIKPSTTFRQLFKILKPNDVTDTRPWTMKIYTSLGRVCVLEKNIKHEKVMEKLKSIIDKSLKVRPCIVLKNHVGMAQHFSFKYFHHAASSSYCSSIVYDNANLEKVAVTCAEFVLLDV
jgi:hypothetical protein